MPDLSAAVEEAAAEEAAAEEAAAEEAAAEEAAAEEAATEEAALSALTPSPFGGDDGAALGPQDASSIALGAALEDPIPADSDFGAAAPSSMVLPSGLADLIGASQWGWASTSQQDDLYSGGAGGGANTEASASSGPSDPLGAAQWGWASGSQEVYAFSGAPQDGANANALNGSLGDYTDVAGGASAGPYLDPDFESLWSAGKAGGLDTSRYLAANGDVVADDPTITPDSSDPAGLLTGVTFDTVTITGNKTLPDGDYEHSRYINNDGVIIDAYTNNDGAYLITGGRATAQSPAPAQSSELPDVPTQITANSSMFSNAAPNLTTAPSIFANSAPGLATASAAGPLAPTNDPAQTQLSNVAGSPASTPPGAAPYDPMAGSPVARWLLKGGANTPIRDFVTNDALLQGLQYGALVAAGAATIVGAGLLLAGAASGSAGAGVLAGTGGTTSVSAAAGDSVGLVAEATGSTAASNAPGFLARLLADTVGSGSSSTVKVGLATVGLGVAASNPGIADEVERDMSALAPEIPSALAAAAQRTAQLASQVGEVLDDFAIDNMTEEQAAYQEYAGGLTPGKGYYVTGPNGVPVQFDGLERLSGKLIEAKYFLDKGSFMQGARAYMNNPFTRFAESWAENRATSILAQAERQVAAAGNSPILWRVAGREAAALIELIFKVWKIPIDVEYFPPRP